MKKLIKRPIITEKSLALANQENIYTFEVDYLASKTQIKSLVETLFEVEVEKINIIISPSKRRRTGSKRLLKLSPVYKKALVKVKSGQKIELFDVSEQ